MTDYSTTKSRVIQWLGIILIIGLFAGAYWYFQVRASTIKAADTVVFITTPGASTWTVPAGVTKIKVEAIGAGGGGGSATGSGGGGGAYAIKRDISVMPGSSISVSVGTGGALATAGTDSIFDTSVVVAKGGAAGVNSSSSSTSGGAAASCIPTTGAFSGGNGGRNDTSYNSGGAGGGAASYLGAGGNSGGNGSAKGGAGGGGSGGGTAGGNSIFGGAVGGSNDLGVGGGTPPAGNGSNGGSGVGHSAGGGAGGFSNFNSSSLWLGGVGGNGAEWDITHGSGGGGGGGGGNGGGSGGVGGAGGNYGGGGGGGGIGASGGIGGNGIIVISYKAITAHSNTSVSQPQGTGRLDSGLAGYWKLDDGSGTSATDSSTNANTGTLTNGPVWTTGQIGGALDFDGVDDYATVAYNSSLTSSQNITYSFWINPDLNEGIGILGAINGEDGSAYNYIYIDNNGSETGNPIVVITRNIGGSTTNRSVQFAYTVSQWFHYTYTYDGAYERVFINGVPLGEWAQTGNFATNTEYGLVLGRRTSTTSSINAKLDEVRVYNRALSTDEVGQLYRLTTPTGVDTGLKGYWSFNGQDISGTTAYDRSGAGNTGTLTNGPTKVEGKIGQALNFDGTNDYVAMGNVLNIGTEDVTMAAWTYLPNANQNFVTIIGKRQPTGSYPQYEIAVGTILSSGNSVASKKISILFYNGVSFSTTAQAYVTVNDVADGKWHHVVGTRSGSTVKIYVDGVDMALTTVVGGPVNDTTNTGNFTIGWGGASTYYSGKVDEARLYNRALTAAEIRGLYDIGESDKVNSSVSQPQGTGRLDSGLAGYWKMDDGSGTSATDASTNGNTGTLTNGPTWTTGQIGSAATFDGVDDYVTIGSPSGINLSGEMSAFAWIKTSSFGAVTSVIAQGSGACSSGQFSIGTIAQSGNKIDVRWAGQSQTSNGTITADTWTFIGLIRTGSTGNWTSNIYINGVLDKQTIGISTNPGGQTSLSIGKMGSCTSAYFTGTVDEARVYNRALSADEVGQLYRLNAPTGVDTGLKGYWSFNGQDMSGTTAYDRSGAGNTGTLTNGPTITEGKLGQALSFDGTDDYIPIGDPANLRFGTTSFSVSTWFKTTSTSQAYMVCDYASNNTIIGLGVNNTGNTNKAYFFLRGNTGVPSDIIYSTTNVNDGKWHHLLGVRNASTGHMRLYLDGVEESSNTFSGATTFATLNSWSIGRAGSSSGFYFPGSIDEVRVYDRALTAGEIASLYNQSR